MYRMVVAAALLLPAVTANCVNHSWNGTKCSSVAGCEWVADDAPVRLPYSRCLPTQFLADYASDRCGMSISRVYWKWLDNSRGYSGSRSDDCAAVGCLKDPEGTCASRTGSCVWYDGQCRSRISFDVDDKLEAFTKDMPKNMSSCAKDALYAARLNTAADDWACGPSVLSPDCMVSVDKMGGEFKSCAGRAMEAYYGKHLEFEVGGLRNEYDCTMEAVKECAFHQTRFCGAGRTAAGGYTLPTLAEAQGCVADYNCFTEKYNKCAESSRFVLARSLKAQELSSDYQVLLDTEACMRGFEVECGGSIKNVVDACNDDPAVCAARIRCYSEKLATCGATKGLWDQEVSDTIVKRGAETEKDTKCFVRNLRQCDFPAGFCDGVETPGVDTARCLEDVACAVRAAAPCAVDATWEAATELRGCSHVGPWCDGACSRGRWGGDVAVTAEARDACVRMCRMDCYTQCMGGVQPVCKFDASPTDVVQVYGCTRIRAAACGYVEDAFCTVAGETPTAEEAASCDKQARCVGEELAWCGDKAGGFMKSTARLVKGAYEAADTSYTAQMEATRTCITDSEAACGTSMQDLGYNVAQCVGGGRAACEERAHCMLKAVHKCGVDSGLLRDAVGDALDSTGYSRCLLEKYAGDDLAARVADLDSRFFFDAPSSRRLMLAHAECAGWSAGDLKTLLPDSVANPVEREVSSAVFCSRSLGSLCGRFSRDSLPSVLCGFAALYRCRDGSAFNEKVDSCFTEAAGACGSVAGVGTWENVKGVSCVDDVVKCAKMAVCLPHKVFACLGGFNRDAGSDGDGSTGGSASGGSDGDGSGSGGDGSTSNSNSNSGSNTGSNAGSSNASSASASASGSGSASASGSGSGSGSGLTRPAAPVSSDGLSSGAIIAIAVGGAVGAAAVGLGGFLAYKFAYASKTVDFSAFMELDAEFGSPDLIVDSPPAGQQIVL